jgi:hypothetical protein
VVVAVVAAVEPFEAVSAADSVAEAADSVEIAEEAAEEEIAVAVVAVAFPRLSFPLEAGHQEAAGTLQTFRKSDTDSAQILFAAADEENSREGHPSVGVAAAADVERAPEVAHTGVSFARRLLALLLTPLCHLKVGSEMQKHLRRITSAISS